MTLPLRRPMTLDEFLAWEARQDLRYEFDGVGPLAMVGGTAEHHDIAQNLTEALRRRLRGGPCRAFQQTMKVRVAERVRYPDVVVTCVPVPRGATVIDQPVVVCEVASEGTARTDRVAKFAEYRDTPSIEHYVILEQAAPVALVFSRADDWRARNATEALVLPSLGVEVPLAEVYEGVEFQPQEPEAEARTP
jgi:Uma2 family endonuclease